MFSKGIFPVGVFPGGVFPPGVGGIAPIIIDTIVNFQFTIGLAVTFPFTIDSTIDF